MQPRYGRDIADSSSALRLPPHAERPSHTSRAGAYYYYNTAPNASYEQTMLRVAEYAAAARLPLAAATVQPIPARQALHRKVCVCVCVCL